MQLTFDLVKSIQKRAKAKLLKENDLKVAQTLYDKALEFGKLNDIQLSDIRVDLYSDTLPFSNHTKVTVTHVFFNGSEWVAERSIAPQVTGSRGLYGSCHILIKDPEKAKALEAIPLPGNDPLKPWAYSKTIQTIRG